MDSRGNSGSFGYISMAERLADAQITFQTMSGSFDNTPVTGWTVVPHSSYSLYAVTMLLALVLYLAIPSSKDTNTHELGGLSILTAWSFFSRRFDFLRYNFALTGQDAFSFKVLQVGSPAHVRIATGT